jgi:type III secretion protein J
MHAARGIGRYVAIVGVVTGATAGCSVPVAGGLDDPEVNRVVLVLERANVEATREPDPGADGLWRVEVARDDLPRALSALQGEQLPRHAPPGVLDALGKGSIVPSETAENAQLAAGIAGELQRSLEGLEGVLRARVHLSVPTTSPLREAPPARASAAVLIEHRGAAPPITSDAVQRLVAGAVAGMQPSDVAVVQVPRPEAPAALANEWGHVGPIAVARTSVRRLQAALLVLGAVVALLAGATLLLYSQLGRARAALAREPATPQ